MKKVLVEKCKTLGIQIKKNYTKEKIMELIALREKTKTKEISPQDDDPYVSVKYIYHLADIHIRVMDRHQEYREVFENLYKAIDEKESIVVICGDLFNNKDRFTSETIVLFNEFVERLSKITYTFVIVGNHDCFYHSDRLDSLSGIVSIAKHPRLFLLKESGVYTFKNVQFGVSSITDSNTIISADKLSGNFTKIALYHGCVGKVELGQENNTITGIDTELFDGYDYTLLGDIHKRQYITNTMAYPGSLIQQNHGEELSHGMLLWDISKGTSQYIPIHNDYSFITIKPDVSLNLELVKFTKYSRIRLLIDDVHEENVEEISKQLEKYTEVLSIKKVLKSSKLTTELKGTPLDVNQKEAQAIKDLSPCEKMTQKITELHADYCTKEFNNRDNLERDSIPWTVDYVEFKNIFSYGDDVLNRVDLKTGITGILGENAIGKSSILNTILYGIFGNVYKSNSYTNKNIISKYSNKENLYVKVSISTENNLNYTIERTSKNKKRSTGIGMEETLRFYSTSSGVNTELNMANKTDTENLIRQKLSIIGKQEFILTNLLSNVSYGFQNNMLSMSNVQLEETFEALFDLEKYTNIHKQAKEDYKILLKKKENNRERIKYLDERMKKIDIDTADETLEIAKEKLYKSRKQNEELHRVLEEIQGKIVENNFDKKSKQKVLEEIEECKKVIKNSSPSDQTEKSIRDQITILEDCCKGISPGEIPKDFEPGKLTLKELEIKLSVLEDKRQEIDNTPYLSEDYIKAKKVLKNLNNEATLNLPEIISTIKNLDKNNTHYLLPFNVREKIIDDLSSKYYIDPNELLYHKNVINKKEEREKQIGENIKNEEKIHSIKRHIKNLKIYKARQDKEKLSLLLRELEVVQATKKLRDLEKHLEYLNENKETEKLLAKKEQILKSIASCNQTIEDLILLVNNTERDIVLYDEMDVEIDELIETTKPITEEVKALKLYTEMTHSKNMPKMIIRDTVQMVVKTANRIIYNMTGLVCSISEINDKWEISLEKNNLSLGPEHCSGYERFIINTGLKLGLDKYKHMSSVKMFLIDEVIDCVSEENIEKVYELLDTLVTNYKKVIVISHNEDLKKKVQHKINIKQTNNSSKLV